MMQSHQRQSSANNPEGSFTKI